MSVAIALFTADLRVHDNPEPIVDLSEGLARFRAARGAR
jgi:hypothetical protein